MPSKYLCKLVTTYVSVGFLVLFLVSLRGNFMSIYFVTFLAWKLFRPFFLLVRTTTLCTLWINVDICVLYDWKACSKEDRFCWNKKFSCLVFFTSFILPLLDWMPLSCFTLRNKMLKLLIFNPIKVPLFSVWPRSK